jgi:repressor LexA
MTPKQKKVYRVILKFMRRHQYPPTVRELMNILKITPNGVQGHLRALLRKKLIRHQPGQSRTIRIVKPNECPYCGK